jgi:hypothetical protein
LPVFANKTQPFLTAKMFAMFKRTKGYFLLTMLVLTGLAGRLHSDTFTAKERHYLVTELKNSKADLTKAVEGLSNKQLNFRSGKNKLSIRECVYQLVSIENNLWMSAKNSLRQETYSLQKSIPNDETLSSLTRKTTFQCQQLEFKTAKEALKLYKKDRTEMLRYVNTSTENVRAHVCKTSVGNFDVYQLMLLNSIYSKYYAQLIGQIKSAPNFPK